MVKHHHLGRTGEEYLPLLSHGYRFLPQQRGLPWNLQAKTLLYTFL